MSGGQTSKTERMRLALAGEQVDRPPVGFWGHNYARENSAEELAGETVDRFRRFDWDFVKIQSRASAFAEDWGNRYQRSTQATVKPVLLEPAVRSTADLRALRPLNPLQGVLGEQIEALRMIRQTLGPDVPVIHTVFAPAMVLSYLVGESARTMLEYVRGYPSETRRTLEAIRATYVDYTHACLENGADGIFFAVKAATAEEMTREEYGQFGMPFDMPVLEAAGRGWFNMLHLHGENLYFEVTDFLPSHAVNWSLDPGNPGLSEGRERARRAVVGGVSIGQKLVEMKPEQVQAEVEAAVKDTGGRRMLVGPSCSYSPKTPEENLFAAREAVEEWKPS